MGKFTAKSLGSLKICDDLAKNFERSYNGSIFDVHLGGVMLQPTEFFFDYAYLKDRYCEAERSYRNLRKKDDYETAIFEITNRFVKMERLNYVKFGPYWWAVKLILAQRGFQGYALDGVENIREAYTVRNPDTQAIDEHATIIAAWEFKDFYNDHYLQGNRTFQLWDIGATYTLWDMEFEALNF